ncbi:unnamed protein product [Psylliodes chrysocephalus]|uniref:Uncharacterized protein n=1 Tax=Psylliodes chrysocephalus TaxID=3402493 RepID=A0A9P0GG27_9CUCU|nr:unnamed protein product [Psylliodes chrysocephala]
MQEATNSEAYIAKELGQVEENCIPCIRVVANGEWSKRSYNVNYDVASGVNNFFAKSYGTALVKQDGVSQGFCPFLSCRKILKPNKRKSNSQTKNRRTRVLCRHSRSFEKIFIQARRNSRLKGVFRNTPAGPEEENNFKGKQSNDDADTLIVSTAIAEANISATDSKVAVVAEDINVLVILVTLTLDDKEIFYTKLPKDKTPGCDTSSVFYGKGKTKLAGILKKSTELEGAEKLFKTPDAHLHDLMINEIKLILALYGAKNYNIGLNDFIFKYFCKNVASKKTKVLLCSLLPTADAALQQIKKVYLQIQCWMGNIFYPSDWGWEFDTRKNFYKPIMMTNEAAPSSLLEVIFCSCITTGCAKVCGCRKAGLYRTAVCVNCAVNDCTNCKPVLIEDADDGDPAATDFVPPPTINIIPQQCFCT